MADYPGEIRQDGIDRLASFGVPVVHYVMRGWRPLTSDYEVWTSEGYLDLLNPSRQPIQNITIPLRWVEGV